MALSTHLRLGRVSNLPTVWTNCLAAAFLASAGPDLPALGVAVVAMSLFYVGGMFLNDAFDHRFDSQHRSERPIPSGDVGIGEVYVVGFGCLVAGETALVLPGVVLDGAIDLEAGLWGLLLAALVVYYDFRHKRDPLSPVVMALCRVMVYLGAAALVGTALDRTVVVAAALVAGYLIGLTYVAKQENLAAIGNSWPVALIGAPFIYHLGGLLPPGVVTVVWAIFLAWVVYALSFVYRTTGRSIPRTVVGLIAGIALLDTLAMAAAGAGPGFIAAGVACFLLTLGFQRFIPGT